MYYSKFVRNLNYCAVAAKSMNESFSSRTVTHSNLKCLNVHKKSGGKEFIIVSKTKLKVIFVSGMKCVCTIVCNCRASSICLVNNPQPNLS